MEMRPVVVVDVISVGGIQEAIRRSYVVAGQIGSRIRRYCRSGSRLWIFPISGIGPSGRCCRRGGTSRSRSCASGGDRLGIRRSGHWGVVIVVVG